MKNDLLKKYRGLMILILCITLGLIALTNIVLSCSATTFATENWTYLNDLSGSYTIQSADPDFIGKEFDIVEGATSTRDSNAPCLIVYDSSPVPQANHRFSFMPLEVIEGKTVYAITSAIDNNGRIDVQNGTFADDQPIWFYNQDGDSIGNAAQRWYIKTNDDGKTVQIELAADTRFVIGIGSAKINGYNALRLLTKTGASNQKWKIEPVAGDFGINTHTYIMKDNTDYSDISSENEYWRYLEPLDNSCASRISDIISVGVQGNNLKKTSYNGVVAFSIPYDSFLNINTSFNYANSIYGDWERGIKLGKQRNRDGEIKDWELSDDTWVIKYSDNQECTVHQGAIIIETSQDNYQWERYLAFNLNSSQTQDQWNIDGNIISDGIYIRISYVFEIHCHWRTGWWIFGSDQDEYKNVREISDVFFVAVDGFSEGGDFGVLSIQNLTSSKSQSYECEGFSQEDLKKAETLTDGAQTITGFTIESLYASNAYTIEVAKDNENFVTVFSGYSTTASGIYKIKATSRFGTYKCITVYVCSDDTTKAYFGVPFASVPNETAMVQGTRLFSGSNEYLKNFGLNTTYGWAQVPVYLKGCSINIKSTGRLSSLTGTITFEGLDGKKSIEVSPQKSQMTISLQDPGFYCVNLATCNKDGDITQFNANFWVVENLIGPEINKQLLSLTHEAYDLIPTYYSVDMPRGPYTYIDENGNTVEKQGVLRYAFSTYGAALNFSLRIQKEYAYRLDNGMFKYLNAKSPNTPLSEFEVFEEMYRIAKENVKLNYFSRSNSISMVGTDTKCIISDKGYVYYLGEETFNGDAKNAAPIVALNKAERDALTARQGFLNNFTFVSMPLDSASVKLVSTDGVEYKIAYDIPAGEQLKALGANSGIYTIIEKTVFGVETQYSGIYINESETTEIVVNLLLDTQSKTISCNNDGENYKCKGGFTLVTAKNMFDTHGLICVTYNRCETPIDISDLSNVTFNQTGIYLIKVEDRFGRNYQFTVTVE